jgi:hypothetical protein
MVSWSLYRARLTHWGLVVASVPPSAVAKLPLPTATSFRLGIGVCFLHLLTWLVDTSTPITSASPESLPAMSTLRSTSAYALLSLSCGVATGMGRGGHATEPPEPDGRLHL